MKPHLFYLGTKIYFIPNSSSYKITIIKYPLHILGQQAAVKRKSFKQKLRALKAKPSKEVDDTIHTLHRAAFEHIDCLECANCCKTTGPLFTSTDIARIAKNLGMKQKAFVKEYLRVDEDGDHVLQQVPCTFLGDDNKCDIYDFRPKACREYPHTDMVNQKRIFDLTVRNAAICPAVFEVLEKL